MSTSNEDRYEEILRRIQARKPAGNSSKHSILASVLDGLNALGFLEDLRRKRLPGINLYGPNAMRGLAEAQHWAGAIAWYKRRGYHHYHEIKLLGIWAVEAGGGIWVALGTKTLQFDMPVFTPESYYRNIRQRFDMHYPDDGRPPHPLPVMENDAENAWRWAAEYEAARRLALREGLEAALKVWTAELRQADESDGEEE